MPRAIDPRTAAPDRRGRGAAVEAAARAYLLERGLRAVAANAHYRFGELDLVMLDGATVAFVEVRYRRDDRFGGGAASVDARKRRKLVMAAQAFLLAHPVYADSPCRFDVIEADGDPARPDLNWLRDAFRADDI
ncbi:YraN family protein [Pseudomonas sp. CGJS7]|uniref:YraN family protein n=1 Tax=Pseudomonas sp. CGJS7 TaxID=3109348 RepID=UPI003009A73F